MYTHGSGATIGAWICRIPGITLGFHDMNRYKGMDPKICEKSKDLLVYLTDPDIKRDNWNDLLFQIMLRVAGRRGGFVINAGLYVPWNINIIKTLRAIVENLCSEFSGYRYHIYTAMIPSFNGEWTFIAVTRSSNFMKEPEHIMSIPGWIRRQIRTLTNVVIDTPRGLIDNPSLEKIY